MIKTASDQRVSTLEKDEYSLQEMYLTQYFVQEINNQMCKKSQACLLQGLSLHVRAFIMLKMFNKKKHSTKWLLLNSMFQTVYANRTQLYLTLFCFQSLMVTASLLAYSDEIRWTCVLGLVWHRSEVICLAQW